MKRKLIAILCVFSIVAGMFHALTTASVTQASEGTDEVQFEELTLGHFGAIDRPDCTGVTKALTYFPNGKSGESLNNVAVTGIYNFKCNESYLFIGGNYVGLQIRSQYQNDKLQILYSDKDENGEDVQRTLCTIEASDLKGNSPVDRNVKIRTTFSFANVSDVEKTADITIGVEVDDIYTYSKMIKGYTEHFCKKLTVDKTLKYASYDPNVYDVVTLDDWKDYDAGYSEGTVTANTNYGNYSSAATSLKNQAIEGYFKFSTAATASTDNAISFGINSIIKIGTSGTNNLKIYTQGGALLDEVTPSEIGLSTLRDKELHIRVTFSYIKETETTADVQVGIDIGGKGTLYYTITEINIKYLRQCITVTASETCPITHKSATEMNYIIHDLSGEDSHSAEKNTSISLNNLVDSPVLDKGNSATVEAYYNFESTGADSTSAVYYGGEEKGICISPNKDHNLEVSYVNGEGKRTDVGVISKEEAGFDLTNRYIKIKMILSVQTYVIEKRTVVVGIIVEDPSIEVENRIPYRKAFKLQNVDYRHLNTVMSLWAKQKVTVSDHILAPTHLVDITPSDFNIANNVTTSGALKNNTNDSDQKISFDGKLFSANVQFNPAEGAGWIRLGGKQPTDGIGFGVRGELTPKDLGIENGTYSTNQYGTGDTSKTLDGVAIEGTYTFSGGMSNSGVLFGTTKGAYRGLYMWMATGQIVFKYRTDGGFTEVATVTLANAKVEETFIGKPIKIRINFDFANVSGTTADVTFGITVNDTYTTTQTLTGVSTDYLKKTMWLFPSASQSITVTSAEMRQGNSAFQFRKDNANAAVTQYALENTTLDINKTGLNTVTDPFNLKISIEFVDLESDGHKNDVRYGLYFNDKLYDDRFFYSYNDRDAFGDYLEITDDGVVKCESVTRSSNDNVAPYILEDFGVEAKEYKTTDEKTNYKATMQMDDTEKNSISGEVALNTKAKIYFYGNASVNGCFYLCAEYGEMVQLLGNTNFTQTNKFTTGDLGVKPGEEFTFTLSKETLDADSDGLKDDVRLGIWINNQLHKNKYFYFTDLAESMESSIYLNYASDNITVMDTLDTIYKNLSVGEAYQVTGNGNLTMNGNPVDHGDIIDQVGDYTVRCTDYDTYVQLVSVYKPGDTHLDGTFTVQDIVAMTKAKNNVKLNTKAAQKAADYDKNGTVDDLDCDGLRSLLLEEAEDENVVASFTFEENVMPIMGGQGPYRKVVTRGESTCSFDSINGGAFKLLQEAGINLITRGSGDFFPKANGRMCLTA